MSATECRFVSIETTESRYLAKRLLTLRFCKPEYDDGPVLRIGYQWDDDDKEICWLTEEQVGTLLIELHKEYASCSSSPSIRD
jgi:hypothetical protein